MSFSADIEHIWTPPEQLTDKLLEHFPQGACVIFANEEFTAAIPATNEQTSELADLMEIAAAGEGLQSDDVAMKAYCVKRDELSAPLGYQKLSFLFKQEMEQAKDKEEADNAPYLRLASAAKPKFIN